MSITLHMLSRAIAGRSVRIVIPACCGIVTAGPYPYSAYGAPVIASTFAAAAAVATGFARAAAANGDPTRVLCFAGDGGTYDIGLATVSAAAERNEDILFICYDNEIYGNTGGQRSSATPLGATTTTTPAGKRVPKKDILGVMAAHRIPYAASISLAHPEDMMRKLTRALDARGFRFLHVLSPCPTGWKSEPAEGIELVRLAVDSGLYPVLEIVDGREWTLNVRPTFSETSLRTFIESQGRFARSEVSAREVREGILEAWDDLWLRCERRGGTAGEPAAGRGVVPPPHAAESGPKQHPVAAE
jgi:pyruvate ferredoxin oxidoreductase beta subunit/2-oxoisovalerate ferredoxin oxidoreductase beta subunit